MHCNCVLNTGRAANLAFFACKWILGLKNETMPPTIVPGVSIPLCMETYRRNYSVTRIPQVINKIISSLADES